ncbi:histidinol-phosphatase HisJ [Planomicrobium sp. CPCC 101079]|uniref:histidinol-phosphatase HisJ n=1 Tax=Planomicrobium sp. CPCC 101079 TaxID=2599618 RepID=UPI0011B4DF09|nr:histidinol-phosphatase HisJ [Planomicrobium sp. CPCC 101079]TWT08896.1 histidinol-phosphatase HisJ [Planomicrobium sp. CPCC 101079]
MKRDGHIHTPFCPHGTKDPLELYIEKAIVSGFTDISFTEHAPLPSSFTDPTPLKDSGMSLKELYPYIDAIAKAKDAYQKDLRIRIGLEVDFIEGFEQETRSFLDEVGPLLDDAILSVHFLKMGGHYHCLDYSKEVFAEICADAGSVQSVYDLYYKTVEASISADLGAYKPVRIGHPTLVHKFQLAHGEKIDDSAEIERVLQTIAAAGYEIDLNSAGFSKPECLESYPPERYITRAKELGIPLVFGSDAHSAKGLHNHYSKLYNNEILK